MTQSMRCVCTYFKPSTHVGPVQINEHDVRRADDPIVVTSPGFWAPLDASEDEIHKIRERVLSR